MFLSFKTTYVQPNAVTQKSRSQKLAKFSVKVAINRNSHVFTINTKKIKCKKRNTLRCFHGFLQKQFYYEL